MTSHFLSYHMALENIYRESVQMGEFVNIGFDIKEDREKALKFLTK